LGCSLPGSRQEQLKVSDHEFISFCNIHKVSPEELKDTYADKEVDETLIAPIARILGKTNI